MDELERLGIETGLDLGDFGGSPGAIVGDVSKLADVLNGGDQKRLRAARAERDGKFAERDAAVAQLEAAKLAASMPAVSYGTGAAAMQAPGGGGVFDHIMATLKGPSPIPHVPVWGLLVGAVGVYLLVSK